jgi:hypothetical protein
MIAIAPAIAFVVHRAGPTPGTAHAAVLADPVERLWRETTDARLRVFSSYDEFTDAIPFYMHDHPLAVHVLDATASQAAEARIGRDGIALVCPARSAERPSADWCINAAIARARCLAPGKQTYVEVSRRYLGVDGKPERYLLIASPPLRPASLPSLQEPIAGYAARHFSATE